MNTRDNRLMSRMITVAETFQHTVINQYERELVVSEFTSAGDLINFRNTAEDMLLSENIEAKITTTYNPYIVKINWR
jgi:hypothetical protein